MQILDKLYINGRWVAPVGRGVIDVHSSFTEEVIAQIPEGDETDAEAAVAAAETAFDSWSQTPPKERAVYVKKICDGLKARSEEIARTIRCGSRDATKAIAFNSGRHANLSIWRLRENDRRLRLRNAAWQFSSGA